MKLELPGKDILYKRKNPVYDPDVGNYKTTETTSKRQ